MATPPAISMAIVVGADYVIKYGPVASYETFLADCFKYAFVITAINGTPAFIDPFKQEYLTSATQLQIDIQENSF